MAIGGGTLVVLGTTVVAVLAVAAAVGADALAVHSTVEAAPSASSSPEPSETSSTNSMSDDFCTLMGELKTYHAAKSAEPGLLSGTIDVYSGEDPAVLDALHKDAGNIAESTATMAAYLDHGADVVSDTTVVEPLRTMAVLVEEQGESIARIAREATSVEGFVAALFGVSLGPGAQETASEASAAGGAINEYVSTECGIDISAVLGVESSANSATGAKSDASTLGMEIAIAFVDWMEGDPLPTVDLSDGMYGVTTSSTSDGGTSSSSSFFSAESSDPAIVEQAIIGPTDWCVSVIDNAAAPPTTYRYSSTGGLEEGTCAALADGA